MLNRRAAVLNFPTYLVVEELRTRCNAHQQNLPSLFPSSPKPHPPSYLFSHDLHAIDQQLIYLGIKEEAACNAAQ